MGLRCIILLLIFAMFTKKYTCMSNQRKARVDRKIKKLVKSKAKKVDGRKNFGPRKSDNNYKDNPFFQKGTVEAKTNHIGNRFWENRSRHGREKIFADPIALVEAAEDYFNYVDNNPWFKAEWKGKRMVKLPTQMPYTWEGFCLYIGTAPSYFTEFRRRLADPDYQNSPKLSDSERADFLGAVELVEKCIRNQKYNGAAAGYFKENLISYDLGIRKDEPQMEVSGSGVSIIVKSDEDKELLESVRKKLKD